MNFTKYIETQVQERNKDLPKRKIGFIEGAESRMIDAASETKSMGLIEPILIFETKEEKAKAKNIDKLTSIVIGEDKDLFERAIKAYVEKRKGKETEEDARKLLKKNNYFTAILVEMGELDGAIGGVTHPTSEVLRAAFKAIGPKEGVKTISSIMIMHKEDSWFIFTDISVNVSPTMEQVYEIAKNAADFGDYISFKRKVAFLSFSTAGSAVNEFSEKMRGATEMFNKKWNPKYKAIGEIQFDAAFDLDIRKSKYKYPEGFKKMPTVFVFPDLNSGNIGYKIAQRMGSWGAVGPIITGLKKPLNDLSRGATVEDIKYTAIITALQGFPPKKA